MAVRFLFGRAGSGKTHYCLQAIREQLLEDPVSGPALILFIPEQAAVQAERMLLSTPELEGASRYHTMSFRRLQQMVLSDTGFAGRELVGPVGRQMILQYLLLRESSRLQVLARVADRPGTAAKVAGSIMEFMQEGLLSSHVQAMAQYVLEVGKTPLAKGAAATVPSALLAGKLHDLGLIYEAYLKWLVERQQADPAGLLAETADRLEQCPWLRRASIWVDGFASFSAQQRYALGKLAQVAGHIEIALLMDPAVLAGNQPPEPYDLFYRTWQTCQQLRQAFLDANVEIEEPAVLQGSPPARFRERPILGRIESQLFATAGPVDSARSKVLPETEFEVVAAPSRQAEVEAVARRIIDLTRVAPRDEALRYRQIAVVVRDLEAYHDIFQTVFAAHAIPYFIDKRRSVSHHPLVELVRAMLRLLADDWPIDAVAAMLKTGLVPIPRDRADLVENYLLAHGISGWANWCGQEWGCLRRFVGADEDPAPPSEQEQQTLRKANYARRMLCRLLRDWTDSEGAASDERRVTSDRQRAESDGREATTAMAPQQRGTMPPDDARPQTARVWHPESLPPSAPAQHGPGPRPDSRVHRTVAPGGTVALGGTVAPGYIGREWAERLYTTLERLKVPQRLMRWQVLAKIHGGPGGLEQGQQHKQVWSLLTQLLDDLVAGLGEEPMDVEQFQATIEAGLEAFSLPLIPPVVDQVVVGSVDRSRQPDITAAFILGFNEGLFPHRSSQDVMLGDHERDLLTELGREQPGNGIRVTGNGEQQRQTPRVELMTGKQRLFDERLLAYIALTRASRYLWVSYATADESGKALLPSPYLRAVRAVLPGLAVRTLEDPLASLRVDEVGTVWQAATGVVLAGRTAVVSGQWSVVSGNNNKNPPEGGTANKDTAQAKACTPNKDQAEACTPNADGWASLGRWMVGDLTLAQKVRRVASACDYTNGCEVRAEQAKALFGAQLNCSVSQLQEYAVCPYRYFAHYGLRLKERPEFELAAVELGSFYHRILYKLATKVRQRGQSLRTVSHEMLNDLVNQTTSEELKAVLEEMPLTGGREAYLLERAKVDIGSALRGHLGLWRSSSFDPAVLEAGFGVKDGWQGLEIRTPKGRCAVLRGKIDRIDVASMGQTNSLAVIDYKRSSRYKLRLDDAFAGLQVQLIVYMKAAMEAAGKGGLGAAAAVPGGMYYFNILPTWEKVAPGELVDPAKGQDGKQWQLKGFTNTDCLPAFHGDGDDGDWPVEIRLKNDGQPYANCPAVDTAAFKKIIDHVWQSLGRTVDKIADGEFAAGPYKAGQDTPCGYCPFDAVCRFAPEFNPYRQIGRSGSVKKCLEMMGNGGQ